ncbi:MAG TPA: rod shape-determining protein MreC [Gemmatimonadota bacterium]|nr:rod shape-determining protein MreC [Gemmatimonadota bacterium]
MTLFRETLRAEAVAVGLAVVSLAFLTLPEPDQQSLARRANHVLLLPLSQVREIFSGHLRLRRENARLRLELQRARLSLASTRAARLQNQELQRLLGFREDQPVQLVPARVIDRNFSTLPTILLLDAGREDGIEPELPVVTMEGLVGKTVGVGPGTSQVLLYSDPAFSASALLVGGDHLEYGIVRPAPTGQLQLLLPLRSRSEPGDRIVTSGYGGTFPRGIPIGTVDRIREDPRLGLQRIDLVEPAVNLGSVTAVYVLRRDAGTASSTAREVPAGSAGDVPRLFWPGYAYPPMAGESFGARDPGGSDSMAAAGADSIPVRDTTEDAGP